MPGSIEEIDHLMCGPDCQRVLGESRPRKDVGGHLTSKLELSIGRLREERKHHVLQGDDADAKMHELSVTQLRYLGNLSSRAHASLQSVGRRTDFGLPFRERLLARI
ncbi:MAG TPA: hypothetical protein VGN43_13935 [Steroidobacteraceae bacterium]|jgi:hypothetical protein|nr:hypothetical protein [Steroidobacteraceae bacterium]